MYSPFVSKHNPLYCWPPCSFSLTMTVALSRLVPLFLFSNLLVLQQCFFGIIWIFLFFFSIRSQPTSVARCGWHRLFPTFWFCCDDPFLSTSHHGGKSDIHYILHNVQCPKTLSSGHLSSHSDPWLDPVIPWLESWGLNLICHCSQCAHNSKFNTVYTSSTNY